MSLEKLSKKLVSLVALTTAQMVQTLGNMHLDFMQNLGSYIMFAIPNLMKTSKPAHPFYKVKLYKYRIERLCVV